MNTAMWCTFLSIVFMSIAPTINKFALQEISPIALVVLNSLICCILVFPFIIKSIFKISKNELKYLLIAGIFNGISMLALFYGLDQSSPALVSMLNRSYIIFSIFLGAFLLKEKIASIDWLLIITAVIGVFLFMYKDSFSLANIGALYGLISALFFSICNFTIKTKLSKTNEKITLFVINLVTFIAFSSLQIINGIEHNTHGPTFDIMSFITSFSSLQRSTLVYVFIGSFFGSFLGLILFYYSLRTIPFYKANLYRSISPVTSLFFGYMFFPVYLSHINIFGLAVLILAFLTHSLVKSKTQKTTQNKRETILSTDELYSADEIDIVKTKDVPICFDSVLVFIKNNKKWLMVKNKKRSWEFPGGHKEINETFIDTAKREALEEAGAYIKDVKYVGYYRLKNKHTTLIVLAQVHHFVELSSKFETSERKFFKKFPKHVSFNDKVYPWLVANFI